MFYFNLCFERTEKVATSEMFERETRRERVLEAINLQKETQLRMKNKGGFLNILAGKKQKSAQMVPQEKEEVKVKVDPLVEAENEFYRILDEVH